MRKNLKRPVALLLSVIMILGFVPMAAASDNPADMAQTALSVSDHYQRTAPNFVPDDFQNALWLQFGFRELTVGETVLVYPRRVPEALTNTITNNLERPNFNFEIVQGSSISIEIHEQDGRNDRATVTATSPGVSVVRVTYDALTHSAGATFGAISEVNWAYFAISVTDGIDTGIGLSLGSGLRHPYDTIYFLEGTHTLHTVRPVISGAVSYELMVNGTVIPGNGDGSYTLPLQNMENIVSIRAINNEGQSRYYFEMVNARLIEIEITNVSQGNRPISLAPLSTGETAAINFRGITMPVHKLATIYNPESTRLQFVSEAGTHVGLSSQWDLASRNTITAVFHSPGTFTFTEGVILQSWWGEELGADKHIVGMGSPNLNAPTFNDVFSLLPNFSITVEESADVILDNFDPLTGWFTIYNPNGEFLTRLDGVLSRMGITPTLPPDARYTPRGFDYSIVTKLRIVGQMAPDDFFSVQNGLRPPTAGLLGPHQYGQPPSPWQPGGSPAQFAISRMHHLVELDMSQAIISENRIEIWNNAGNAIIESILFHENVMPHTALAGMQHLERMRLPEGIHFAQGPNSNFATANPNMFANLPNLHSLVFGDEPFEFGTLDYSGSAIMGFPTIIPANVNNSFRSSDISKLIMPAHHGLVVNNNAFSWINALEEVVFPGHVALLGTGVFSGSINAGNLTSITFLSETAPDVINGTFTAVTAFVPDPSTGGFELAQFYERFYQVLEIPAPPIFTAQLEEAIAKAEGKIAAAFSASSWAHLQSALNDAKALLASAELTQEQVNLVLQALLDAIFALELQFSSAPGISVSFRLMGKDTAEYGAPHVAWIDTTVIGLPVGITLSELSVFVADALGFTLSTDARVEYISAVTTPNNFTLAEGDTGSASGWMYRYNGRWSNLGMTEQVLIGGATVAWYFVDDFIAENPDWNDPIHTPIIALNMLLSEIEGLYADHFTASSWFNLMTANSSARQVLFNYNSQLAQVENALNNLTTAFNALVRITLPDDGPGDTDPGDTDPGDTDSGDANNPFRYEMNTALSWVRRDVQNQGGPQVEVQGGEWAVLAQARSGQIGQTDWLETYPNTLYAHINESAIITPGNNPLSVILHNNRPTDNQRVILALTSFGLDASNWRGFDLVSPLTDTSWVMYQGNNSTAFALIALDSMGYLRDAANDPRQTFISDLISSNNQNSDGGWGIQHGQDSSNDMTAMVISALAPYVNNPAVRASVDRALAFLASQMGADGRLGVDSQQNSQTIIALAALGINPLEDSRFIQNGVTLLDGLMTFRVNSGANAGAFGHATHLLSNTIATEQAALALVALERLLSDLPFLYDMSDSGNIDDDIGAGPGGDTPGGGAGPGGSAPGGGTPGGTAPGAPSSITVTFALFGATRHSNEPYFIWRTNRQAFTAWIPTRTMTFNEPFVTVYDVFSRALADAGFTARLTSRNNYVESIHGPDGWLGEFDNGRNSGWMYMVNGVHVNLGLSDQQVFHGDSIIWHFTDDFTQEAGSQAWGPPPNEGNDDEDENEGSIDLRDMEIALEAFENWSNPFSDVSYDAWYFDAVRFVSVLGLMNGTDIGFEPGRNLSRAMLITILARAANIDTSYGSTWYYNAVSWGMEFGITDGTNLSDDITREQLVTMLHRFSAGLGIGTAQSGDLSAFADAHTVSPWAADAMGWAVNYALIQGRGENMLVPVGAATRAETATILMRFFSTFNLVEKV